MAKLTYLQIVQRVLSAIDADNVTSFSDTEEAEQVAELVQTVYNELSAEFPWFHKRGIIQLELTATANIMRVPAAVDNLMSDILYYSDQEVRWVDPREMQHMLAKRDKTLSNVDANGAMTDRDPKYWSSYNDDEVILDSYDGSLVSSNTAIYAASGPAALTTETQVPDLPVILHSTLLYGVLEEAYRTLKGDEVGARSYGSKYKKSKARAKRWAYKMNKENDPGAKINYGRRNGLTSSNETSTHRIIEGT